LVFAFEGGTCLIHRGEDDTDVVDDRGAMCGIVNFQIADNLDQHFQFLCGGGDVLVDLFRVSDFGQLVDLGCFFIDLFLVRIERTGLEQELDAAM